MTQIIVLLIIVLGNMILGVLAKRYKERERKRREAEGRRDSQPRADAADDEDEGFLDIILREAERRTQTERPNERSAPPTAATTSAPPTALPTPSPRVGMPPPTATTPTVPTPVAPRPQTPTRPAPQSFPPPAQPYQQKPAPQRRPQETGPAGTKTPSRPLGVLSSRTESPGAKRRRLEHAARVKERAARKLARQEWSRARKARVTKRTSKLSTAAAAAAKGRAEAAKRVTVVHPVIAAIRDVFRNRSSLQAAFLVGDILRRRDSSDERKA
ncbi:MAG: hypothetical protein JNM94_01505 [Phycisphaerae bacterium]|nr:hypothetical protein [Phycisphaerae bacterium]